MPHGTDFDFYTMYKTTVYVKTVFYVYYFLKRLAKQ